MSVWDRLVGQSAAVSLLQSAAARPEQLAHAWLFVGPAGAGRTTAARAFAAALQCSSRTGCGECADCREVLVGSHPLVRTWRTEALTLDTEGARDLVVEAAAAVPHGRWRVIVIEDADRLHERASNVLLKAIEEPGSRVVWLLCAPSDEPDPLSGYGVRPTIRSRCRLVSLPLPSAADITRLLVSEGVDEARAAFCARAAQGHVGRARRLATDESAMLRRLDVLRIPTRLQSPSDCMAAAADLIEATKEDASELYAGADASELKDLKDALGVGVRGVVVRGTAGQVKELEKAQKSRQTRAVRDSLDLALVDLVAFYRDVLALQLGTGAELVHGDQLNALETIARGSTPVATLKRIDAVQQCRERLLFGSQPQIAVEALTMSLAVA